MAQKSSPKITLFTSAASSFITTFLASAVTVSLPAIGNSFSLNTIELGWIISSYLLASAIAVVPIGKLSDVYGLKFFFSCGGWTLTISSLFCALAPMPWFLIIGRVGQGIGAAAISSTSIAILSRTFSAEKQGKYLGLNVSAIYMGLTTGPFFGGFITQHFGWRSLFYLTIPFGLLITLLIQYGISKLPPLSNKSRLDIFASVIFGAGLTFLLYGLSVKPGVIALVLLCTSAVCFVIFTKRELTSSNPILGITLLKHVGFAFSNLAALINYCATFAVTYTLTIYLQSVKNYSPQDCGLILMSQPIMMALLSPLAGKLSDYRQPRIIASAGMLLCSIALLILSFLTVNSSAFHVITGLVILGIGCALFSAPNTSAVMKSVPKTNLGIASAFIATMRIVGQMLSIAIAMLVFSAFSSGQPVNKVDTSGLTRGLHLFFLFSSALCCTGIWVSFARGKISSSAH